MALLMMMCIVIPNYTLAFARIYRDSEPDNALIKVTIPETSPAIVPETVSETVPEAVPEAVSETANGTLSGSGSDATVREDQEMGKNEDN